MDEAAPAPSSSRHSSTTLSVYQMKVEYKYKNPKIWRKVLIPANYNFLDLHYVILDSMQIGLCPCEHQHRFDIMRKKISAREKHEQFLKLKAEGANFRELEEFLLNEDEENTEIGDSELVSNWFKTPNDIKVKYIFDFGDSSEFIVVLDKVLSPVPDVEYPRIIGGRCKCYPDHPGTFGEARWQEWKADQKIFNYKEITFPRCKKVILLKK